MDKLISIDFESILGFFKNPQFNGEKESKSYGFDCIHRLAIFGMLGSLVGLKGIRVEQNQKTFELPEFYQKLCNIKIGIQILNENGIKKEWFKINSSSGLFSKEDGGILMINYDTIIKPKYRIYLKLNLNNQYENDIYDILKNDYIGCFGDIYMGKSPLNITRSNFMEHDNYTFVKSPKNVKILTLFKGEYQKVIKPLKGVDSNNKYEINYLFEKNSIINYEREIVLPVSYTNDGDKFKYDEFEEFNYTNKTINITSEEDFIKINENDYIYLF
jgi:CRISPR-associated protein Cas5h